MTYTAETGKKNQIQKTVANFWLVCYANLLVT